MLIKENGYEHEMPYSSKTLTLGVITMSYTIEVEQSGDLMKVKLQGQTYSATINRIQGRYQLEFDDFDDALETYSALLDVSHIQDIAARICKSRIGFDIPSCSFTPVADVHFRSFYQHAADVARQLNKGMDLTLIDYLVWGLKRQKQDQR